MRSEISGLHQKLQTTFIYVTHDQTEAVTLGTRVVVMKDGLIQQIDTPQNLYNNPVNMFVTEFVGTPKMNFFNAAVDINHLKLAEYSFTLESKAAARSYDHGRLILSLHPKDIYEISDGESGIPAKVELVEHLGSETYLYLIIADTPCIANVEPDTKARIGDVN